jgi:hypothetical protein
VRASAGSAVPSRGTAGVDAQPASNSATSAAVRTNRLGDGIRENNVESIPFDLRIELRLREYKV